MDMKPLILILLLTLLTAPLTSAQEGMAIAPFFDEGVQHAPGAEVTSVSITGTRLKDYNLNTYRSMSVSGDPDLTRKIERAVTHDGVKAESRKVSLKDGHLYFGFYTLPPLDTDNRYIFYLNSTLAGGNKVTLIYLQGKAESSEILKMLKR